MNKRFKKISKSILSGVLASTMILSVIAAPISSQAAGLDTSIKYIEEVGNNSGSTKEKPLNLKGESKDIDINIKEKSIFEFAIIGSKKQTAFVIIPEEMNTVIDKDVKATITASAKIELKEDSELKRKIDEVNEKTEEFKNKFEDKEILNSIIKSRLNIEEVKEIITPLEALENGDLDRVDFQIPAEIIEKDGKLVMVADINHGIAKIIAKKYTDEIDRTIKGLEELKIVAKKGESEKDVERANEILTSLKAPLINSLKLLKPIITTTGNLGNEVGTIGVLKVKDIKFHTNMKDPMFHAKDKDGNNIFMPVDSPDEISIDDYEDLDESKKNYKAEFVGGIISTNLIQPVEVVKDILEKISPLKLEKKDKTEIYFTYKPDYEKVERIKGEDRFATATKVSKKSYDKADTVVLAEGYTYADVLTATVMAYEKNAPILLTSKTFLPKVTKNEIKRLDAKNIILVGGEGTVNKDVEKTLKDEKLSIERVSGENRYKTAIAIAKEVRKDSGNKKDIILVNGNNFPDGLIMTSKAVKLGAPILLTTDSYLEKNTEKAIKDFDISRTIIGGGEGSVSAAVENSLSGRVERISGKNRYETAVEVAKDLNTKSKRAVVTNGEDFVDALVAAPYAAIKSSPLILVTSNYVHDSVKDYIVDEKIETLSIVGGVNSVNTNVVSQLEERLSKDTKEDKDINIGKIEKEDKEEKDNKKEDKKSTLGKILDALKTK